MSLAPTCPLTPRTRRSSFAKLSRPGREELTQRLLARRCSTDDPDERNRLRDAVVLINQPLAESIAARYRGMGVEWEDLSQVARIGLIVAVDRFDLEHGARFATFAIPTISGEVKRYLRDLGWTIRPPRSVQENRSSVSRCQVELTQSLGHIPTIGEIATALNMDRAAVAEACASWGCFRPVSLDSPAHPGSGLTLGAMLGHDDPDLDHVDSHATLLAVLNRLSYDERLLLVLRFEEGLSQSQIAVWFGISQMQVCRRLRTLLARLRDELTVNAHNTRPRVPTTRPGCARRGRTATPSGAPHNATGHRVPRVRTARPDGAAAHGLVAAGSA